MGPCRGEEVEAEVIELCAGSWVSIAVRLAGDAIPALEARYCAIAGTGTGFEVVSAPPLADRPANSYGFPRFSRERRRAHR
jgi:hypothetical protein